ncbi:hypothetical protein [Aquariibacter albus]|uniref:Uncharacterized protein n=1 Tax=Aquariibacter albus TaxID=2759899 RepID=A0A839HQ61_9BURK|nr:hypothetical protein [Aquariibacter albus]MBB1161439.1 hypothetical protein [Aquariibacter albus]
MTSQFRHAIMRLRIHDAAARQSRGFSGTIPFFWKETQDQAPSGAQPKRADYA